MVVKLHHVEFLCNNIRKPLGQFCSAFGFQPFAKALNPTRIALKRGSVNFLLTEDRTPRDTVSNVAFEVKNIQEIVQNVQNNDGEIIAPPSVSADNNGHTVSTEVQSPCGNVSHTLLDNTNYNGVFLPGFTAMADRTLSGNSDQEFISHIDHIAFACRQGTSSSIIDWYNKCLGFKRFQVNPDEKDNGYNISSLINGSLTGLKLSAMQYWKCSEVGIEVNPNKCENNVKLVLAETLPGQGGPNQIQTFLDEHGGPGVQHIGLHSTNMVNTVKQLKSNGIEFVAPPKEYYIQENKVQEISSAGYAIESLQNQGILLDAESFKDTDGTTKYLMQVFTKPIFQEDTFFLEIIQRFGATGFGAGNITALWQALDEHLRNSQQKMKMLNE